jgi:SAM-dependent methyltransferase
MASRMKAYQEVAKRAKLVGWDFSVIEDMIQEEPLPFDDIDIVNRFRHEEMTLLDMETGGGEILQKLKHPPHLTTVTEAYPPNYLLCKERLEPKGIQVVNVSGDELLPFANESFDIVINRHGAYCLEEVYRILKPGGYFVTQQVGSKNNLPLRSLLAKQQILEDFTMSQQIKLITSLGYKELEHDECLQRIKYLDIKAVIFMAMVIPWEFPDFRVEDQYETLKQIERKIEKEGFFESYEHRFYIACQKLEKISKAREV